MDVFMAVKKNLATVLQLNNNLADAKRDTPLLGAIPELDSMAVVNVITAIEEQFGVIFDDEEVTAEMFETIGSLSDVVEQKVSAG